MANINTIEDGCGIELTIFINGRKEHFRLCIINRKDYFSDNKQEFAFINDDKTKVIDNVYSGGNTGFGTNNYSFKDPSSWELVTDDLDEIMNIAEKYKDREKQEREAFINKQNERVDKINNLPKLFSTGIEELNKKYAFERSDADFNPVYSLQIKGGIIRLKDITKSDKPASYIYLDMFLTKDRKMQVKQFERSFEYKNFLKEFPETHYIDPKLLLMNLTNKKTEIENEIRKIKQS